MTHASVSCFWLLKHVAACALSFALLKAGNNIAARIAMIAMTTSNSIRVKAQHSGTSDRFFRCEERFDGETLKTDGYCGNIRRVSKRCYFHMNWAGPEKAGGIRAQLGNEKAAANGRHRNDALNARVLHDETFAHRPQLVLQFSSAKNFEHREAGRIFCTSSSFPRMHFRWKHPHTFF